MVEIDMIARYRILCLLETGGKPGRAGSVGAVSASRTLARRVKLDLENERIVVDKRMTRLLLA